MTEPRARIAPQQRVRVKASCPLTLPHYARTREGVVEELAGNEVVVRFGEDRYFPVPEEWLVPSEPDA